MADNDCTIHLAGNLTRDPELRFTQGGVAICSAAIAINRRVKKDDQWVDGPTSFINLNIWRELGENFAASAKKGDRVLVTGQLEVRSYETDNGETKRSTEMQVEDIALSVKWATVVAERTRRSDSTSHSSAPAFDSPPEEEPF